MSNKSPEQQFPFSISDVAEKAGLTPRQVRYYEKMGLLEPHRTPGNQRRYNYTHIEDLKKIKDLLAAHSSIESVKASLAKEDKKPQPASLPIVDPPYVRTPLTSVYPVSNRAVLQELLRATMKQNRPQTDAEEE